MKICCSGAFLGAEVEIVNSVRRFRTKVTITMNRAPSPPITPEMAAHIRFLVNERGLFQHQAASLCGVNQGRVSEVMQGLRHPDATPAQGAFPF